MLPLSEHLAEADHCLTLGQISEEEHCNLRRRLLDAFVPQKVSDGNSVGRPVRPSDFAEIRNGLCNDALLPGKVSTPVNPFCCYSNSNRYKADDEMSDAAFWCKWIEQRSCSTAQERSLDQATVNDLCDVTAGRLEEIFARFDADNDKSIDAMELHDALSSQGFKVGLDGAKQMMLHVHQRKGGSIEDEVVRVAIADFDLILKRLRLAELFTPCAGIFQWSSDFSMAENPIMCTDYNGDLFRVQHPVSDIQSLFFGSRKPFQNASSNAQDSCLQRSGVRWVHVDAMQGLNRLNLLRLAVKYNLHPLAIDDIIDNRTSTKIDRYDENYFLSAEILSLARKGKHRRCSDKPQRVRIHRSHVSVFLAGSRDTLLTIHQNRPDESSWLAMWRGGSYCATVLPSRDLWRELRADIMSEPPKRIRGEAADFLLYQVLHSITLGLRPIAEAYAKRLGFMHQTSMDAFEHSWLQELAEVQLELTDLSRSIRPMHQVIRHLIEDGGNISATTQMYLKDVEDTISEMQDDVLELGQMSRCLEDAYTKHGDKKMNDVLFVLSGVSAIFLPAQFITGLYGMNFDYIPELHWPNGYAYFWGLQLFFLLVAFVALLIMNLGSGGCRKLFQRLVGRCLWLCTCCQSRGGKVHAILDNTVDEDDDE